MVRPSSPPVSVLEDLFTHTAIGIAVLGLERTVEWVNPAFYRVTGGPSSGPLPTRILEWLTTEPPLGPAVSAAFSERTASNLRDVQLPNDGGTSGRFFDLDIQPVGSASGPLPQRVVVSLQEVTERVRERRRADLFYQAFQTSTNPMEVTDLEGVLVDVNPAFEKVYGYTRKQAVGRKPNLVRSKHTGPEVYARLWADLLDPGRGYWSGEIINRDRMGQERPVLLTVTSVRDASGRPTHYLGVAVDLTERKAWERAAAHADKLASLGQLAAGVAHEINTPLANILLVAESIRRKTPDDWVRSRADTIREQVRVADRIVLGLLDFARRNEPHFVSLDLADVTRQAVAFVRGKQSADVEVVEQYPSSPLPVQGDRNQLIQVLANILNNAYDAITGSGTVTVTVGSVNDFASVEVADSGPGIPPEVLPHLFEPFFTTKPEGRGTGLGLAICHGIVQAHRGAIVATNAAAGGARFTLTFPMATRPSKAPTRAASEPAPEGLRETSA